MTDKRIELNYYEIDRVVGGAGRRPVQDAGRPGVKVGIGDVSGGIKNGSDDALNSIKNAADQANPLRKPNP